MQPGELVAMSFDPLVAAQDFVAVAAVICEVTRTHAIDRCEVMQQAEDGRPLILVDNTQIEDADRLRYVDALWREDPLLHALQTTRQPVEADGTLLLPLDRSGGLLGSIRCCPVRTDVRPELTRLAHRASVRLAELGTSSGDPLLTRLTPRQLDVAVLVGADLSNPAIGGELGLSENTVKKHLKDIFAAVGIRRRSELAALIRRAPRREPQRITRSGGITITRG